jgi:hypothetical protein
MTRLGKRQPDASSLTTDAGRRFAENGLAAFEGGLAGDATRM